MLSSFPFLRILIIDDDEDDFFITSGYLQQTGHSHLQVDWCYDYRQAVEHLKNRNYDVYFIDYRLGAKTGLDLLKAARDLGCEDPIILLTGKGNKAISIEAMQQGATDYLVKTELTTEKLERCIRYALERSNSLKALKANERKYRNIFERSKDAVFIASGALQFIDVNPATCSLLGYTREELQSIFITDLVAEKNDRESLRALLREKGDINDLEIELLPKEGEKRNCILSLSRQIDKEEETYIQGIFHDITNLKKAEKANLLAEKLGATSRLVRTLAHEVRNPLNNIEMSAEQLVHYNQQEELTSYLEIVQRNSRRIGDLIKELLDSSHPTELSFTRTALQTVMDKSIAAAVDRITLQRINMQIRYPDEPAWVMADIEKLRIAFLNIIINAIEAMEEKAGHLFISIEQSHSLHTVMIRDNGCGIDEESLSRLFEPYFTSKRNGMGLGLAATLNIIQSHKAQIDVSSAPDEGSTFLINFPAV